MKKQVGRKKTRQPVGFMPSTSTGTLTRLIGVPICPDLLDYSALGVADNLRGRAVRAFFWLMRAWPT